jgi:hypothetical protein
LAAVPIKAASIYYIEWDFYLLKTTAGTMTLTVTFTQAPVNMDVNYTITAIAGLGAFASPTEAGLRGVSAAANALPVTGSLANGANHRCRVQAIIETNAANAGDVRLRATESAGTITVRRGSYVRSTRIPSATVGTFAA